MQAAIAPVVLVVAAVVVVVVYFDKHSFGTKAVTLPGNATVTVLPPSARLLIVPACPS